MAIRDHLFSLSESNQADNTTGQPKFLLMEMTQEKEERERQNHESVSERNSGDATEKRRIDISCPFGLL